MPAAFMEHLKKPVNLKDKKTMAAIIGALLLFVAIPLTVIGTLQLKEGTPHLKTKAAAPPLDQIGFPRITMTGAANTAELTSMKYPVLSAAYGDRDKVKRLRDSSLGGDPNITALRYFSAQGYQGDKRSMPYEDPVTGKYVYPGDWLFYKGTTLTINIDELVNEIPVADASLINAIMTEYKRKLGDSFSNLYAMIWDANEVAGKSGLGPDDPLFWENAEHLLVTGVDTDNNTLTVSDRGYNAKNKDGQLRPFTPLPHNANSRIALHVLEPGPGGPGAWVYNMSLAAPRDPNQGDKQIDRIMGEWLGANLNRYSWEANDFALHDGSELFSGILFDVSGYWLTQIFADKIDINNDGGIISDASSWGEGMEEMFNYARDSLGADHLIVGGAPENRGFGYLNGNQLEGFPGNISIDKMDGDFARYETWIEKAGRSPKYTENFSRFETDVHKCVGPNAQPEPNPLPGNQVFRYTLGMTMLSDGFYAYNPGRKCFGDYWWDEYAVDADGVGQAGAAAECETKPTPEERTSCWKEIKTKTEYLGMPTGDGKYQRLFSRNNPLVDPNDFLNPASWPMGKRINVNLEFNFPDPDPDPNRGNVLKIISNDPKAAATYNPAITLETGKDYTLNFWAKAGSIHDTSVEIPNCVGDTGKELNDILLFPTWKEYFITFTPTTTSTSVRFKLLDETSDVFIDDLQVYEGGANKFRRDFDNGIVLVNGNSTPEIFDLGGKTFKRIDGTQDRQYPDGHPINNGAEVTGSITLKDYDAIILLGPVGTPPKIGDIEPPDGDGDVDIQDLSTLISNWGATSGPADINNDGIVDVYDLSILLSNWGP